jgi:hypothetical protein
VGGTGGAGGEPVGGPHSKVGGSWWVGPLKGGRAPFMVGRGALFPRQHTHAHTLVAFKKTSALTSAARSAAAVSVVKNGLPARAGRGG